MPDLLIATSNPGKLREIVQILGGAPVTLRTLDAFPAVPEPEETGRTFAENAKLKARYYARAAGMLAAADDSGIEIDALGNEPGVRSARWHGTSYPAKFRAIYTALRARGLTTSPARFVCHVAVAEPGGQIVFESTGTVEGEIAAEPRGTLGFGYDPIFYYPPYGSTLAEVDGDRKAAVSHRGLAFRALRDRLRSGPLL